MFNLTLKALLAGGVIAVIVAVAVPMAVLANRDRGAGDPAVFPTATPVLSGVQGGTLADEPPPTSSPDEDLEGDTGGSDGERVFNSASPITCTTCHSLDGTVGLGPSLRGISERAGTQVAGLSAEEYLRESILDTNAFIVEGFPESLMPVNFSETLSAEEVDAVIAFLMTQ